MVSKRNNKDIYLIDLDIFYSAIVWGLKVKNRKERNNDLFFLKTIS